MLIETKEATTSMTRSVAVIMIVEITAEMPLFRRSLGFLFRAVFGVVVYVPPNPWNGIVRKRETDMRTSARITRMMRALG